jgi:hypothetical protein
MNQRRLLVASVLFVCFLVCFFMNLTGVTLHQLIGIAVGGVVVYHLVSHWSWVRTVTSRFMGKTSRQARIYYLVDALLMTGFVVMIGTGLVISTWFDLTSIDFDAWRTVHIAASITSLLLVNLKIALHARWIISAGKKMIHAPGKKSGWSNPGTTSVPASGDRRAFLKLMGLVGAASVYAFGSSVNLLFPITKAEAADQPVNLPGESPASTPQTSTSSVLSSHAAQVEEEVATATAMPVPPTAAVVESNPTSNTCVVRCERSCSFPGHCRRYVDSNSNNRCDYGECIG